MRNVWMLILVLAACAATPEQKAAEAIARQGGYCEHLGYKKGTDGWRQCIMERERQRDAGSQICSVVYGTLICN